MELIGVKITVTKDINKHTTEDLSTNTRYTELMNIKTIIISLQNSNSNTKTVFHYSINHFPIEREKNCIMDN